MIYPRYENREKDDQQRRGALASLFNDGAAVR
jgi:hypothetical protein